MYCTVTFITYTDHACKRTHTRSGKLFHQGNPNSATQSSLSRLRVAASRITRSRRPPGGRRNGLGTRQPGAAGEQGGADESIAAPRRAGLSRGRRHGLEPRVGDATGGGQPGGTSKTSPRVIVTTTRRLFSVRMPVEPIPYGGELSVWPMSTQLWGG